MDWRTLVDDADYVPAIVTPEMPDVVRRGVAAGAKPPLEYVGAGMTSVVLCKGAVAYKIGRRSSSSLRRMLGDEAEWMATAGRVSGVRQYVPRLVRYDRENVVIVRGCPKRDPEMTAYRYGEGRLWDLHRDIEKKMLPHGWTAPEFKADSYVLTKKGPVLVDASMPARVGQVLLDYVREILSGRRTTDERLSDLAFEVRREVGQTIDPADAKPVLDELSARGAT
jgi:hypothetical protein